MKTYTLEEHARCERLTKNSRLNLLTKLQKWLFWTSVNGHCSCCRWFKIEDLWPRAWENCSNCLGRGYTPIPWSELR